MCTWYRLAIYPVLLAIAFNLTGIDVDLYFAVNTTVSILVFGLIVLPALILNVLCVLALLLARDLVWQVKMLLINIFAVEICSWLGQAILFVGFPVRQSLELEADPACGVAVSLFIVTALQKMSATAIYAIMVYVFSQLRCEKVKIGRSYALV